MALAMRTTLSSAVTAKVRRRCDHGGAPPAGIAAGCRLCLPAGSNGRRCAWPARSAAGPRFASASAGGKAAHWRPTCLGFTQLARLAASTHAGAALAPVTVPMGLTRPPARPCVLLAGEQGVPRPGQRRGAGPHVRAPCFAGLRRVCADSRPSRSLSYAASAAGFVGRTAAFRGACGAAPRCTGVFRPQLLCCLHRR